MPDYNFLKLSATQEMNLQTQVIDHRAEAMQARSDFPVRHAERYRRYLADPTMRPQGPWPEAARLFIPSTRDVLEKLQGEVWQAVFGNMLNVQVKPFTERELPSAPLAAQFLRWTLEATLDWEDIGNDLIFDALLDSVGVAKVMAWEPPWPAPSPDAHRYLRRTSKIDALDLGMLLVAPDAEGLQYPECRFIHQEFFLSSDDILRLSRRGFDTPDFDELGDSQDLTERKRVELEREGERIVEFRPDSVYFVESYERFTLDDDIGEEDLIVSWFPDALTSGTSSPAPSASSASSAGGRLAGVRRLIDVFPQDDRPRRPFFPITFWPQPRQWRGLNVADRLESMQDLINRLHEQLVNYGEVSMLPFVFVNTFLTGEIPDLRTVRPGSTVPIDDISGVQFAPTRSLNRHFAEQIQLMQASIERDTQVTDFNLGRQATSSNAPRTASATMALLAETRKTYGNLIRHAARQFSSLLAFHFRLWQSILPEDTYAQIFPAALPTRPARQTTSTPPRTSSTSSSLWDRLFNTGASDTSQPVPPTLLALPISKEALSGIYDVHILVNPEEQFDRQVIMQLFQVTAPALQTYPLGMRMMLKRIWQVFDQKGFDAIYPEEIALMQTQQTVLALEIQIATFQGQLQQIEQQKAQQQLQQLEAESQQFLQTGKVGPNLAQMAQQHMAPAGAAPTAAAPTATNGTANPNLGGGA